MIRILAACAALAALPAAAQVLDLPAEAVPVHDSASALDSHALPVAAFDGSGVPSLRLEGRVARNSWRLTGSPATSLQLLQPLRDQLQAQGFDILFECADSACGGFDFRFAIEVIAAPEMHVNLRDFRFLSATRAEAEAVSVLVSVSRTASYIQTIRVSPPANGS